MLAHRTAEGTTQMLLPLVLLHAPVVQVLNALTLAPSIHASLTHHVMTEILTIAVPLGAMQHLIAYFPAQVVMIMIALMERFASRTHHATRMILLCAELALIMLHHVNDLVRQEVAMHVLLGSHVLRTQHVKRQPKSLLHHLLNHIFLGALSIVVHLSSTLPLSAQSRVQQGWIQIAPVASNASPTLPVPIEKPIFVVTA